MSHNIGPYVKGLRQTVTKSFANEGRFSIYTIGHFINQPANPTEFEILRFAEMEEPDVDDYHKHSFYEILWTEKE